MDPAVRRRANRLTAERNDRVRRGLKPVRLDEAYGHRAVARKPKDKDEVAKAQEDFLASIRSAFQRRFSKGSWVGTQRGHGE